MFTYLAGTGLAILVYLLASSMGLYHRKTKITLDPSSWPDRYNKSIDGGCSTVASNTIQVHEQCSPGSPCAWKFSVQGLSTNVTLQFRGGDGVEVRCSGRQCPPPFSQQWVRHPYQKFKVEVLPVTRDVMDTTGPHGTAASQLALVLGAGWEPSAVPVQERHQNTPNAFLDDGVATLAGSIKGHSWKISKLHNSCWPRGRRVFNIQTSSGRARVDVTPTGEILYHRPDRIGWLYLNDIRFGVSNGNPLQLSTPWSHVPGYQLAAWWSHRGSILVGGVVGNASRTGPIAQLPHDLAPPARRNFNVRSDVETVQVCLQPDGGIWWTGGAAVSWISLDGIAFDYNQPRNTYNELLTLEESAAADPEFPPQLTTDEASRVTLAGLVQVPHDGRIAVLLKQYAPPLGIRAFATGNTSMEVSVSASGVVAVPPDFAGRWLSLAGVAYYTSCWQTSEVHVSDGGSVYQDWYHYKRARYDIWHQHDVTLEECQAACVQLRCASLQHTVRMTTQGDALRLGRWHCAVKFRDRYTAAPELRYNASETPGTTSYTYVCPVPESTPMWLSPQFRTRTYESSQPTLSLVTPSHRFPTVHVEGPVAYCFWDDGKREIFSRTALLLLRGVVYAVAACSAASCLLFCSASVAKQRRRSSDLWYWWLFKAGTAAWLLSLLLQIVAFVQLKYTDATMVPGSPFIDGALLIVEWPFVIFPFMASCVPRSCGIALSVPPYGFRRAMVIGAEIGLLGHIVAVFTSVVSGYIQWGEWSSSNKANALAVALFAAVMLGFATSTVFNTWFSLGLSLCISCLLFFPIDAVSWYGECGGCDGIFVTNGLWQGLIVGLLSVTTINLVSSAHHLVPDNGFVAGVVLRWRWRGHAGAPQSRTHWAPGQVQVDNRLIRRMARRQQLMVAILRQQAPKAVGSVLTLTAMVLGTLTARQVDLVWAPLGTNLAHRAMLELGEPWGFLCLSLSYVAVALLCTALVWLEKLFVLWVRQTLVFVPTNVACSYVVATGLYCSIVGAALWRVVDHSSLLLRAGQLVMGGLPIDNLVNADVRPVYFAIYVTSVAVGVFVGLLFWLNIAGLSLLHLAAASLWCPATVARVLIATGVSVHAKRVDGRTALHVAASRGHPAVLRVLLRHGGSVATRDIENNTPVHAAAARTDGVAAIQVLLDHARKTYAGCSGRRNLEIILTARNKQGDCPLHIALRRRGRNRDAKVAALLSELPREQVMTKNGDGATALHIVLAHRLGEDAALLELIAKHGDLSSKNTGDETPVHLAAAHPNGLRLLREALDESPGAPTWTTSQGKTPLFYAVEQPVDVRERIALLAHPEAIDQQTKDQGWTCLHMACREYKPDIVRCLLEHNANPAVRDHKDKEPSNYLQLRYKKLRQDATPGAKPDAEAHATLLEALRKHSSHVEEATMDARFASREVGSILKDISAGRDLRLGALRTHVEPNSLQLLSHAAQRSNEAALLALLQAGADASAETRGRTSGAVPTPGHTAAMWCLWAGNGLERHLTKACPAVPTDRDRAAIQRRVAVLDKYPANEYPEIPVILNLKDGPPAVVQHEGRSQPPQPLVLGQQAGDLFPLELESTLPGLMDWLLQLGADPAQWPLKACHLSNAASSTDNSQGNEPMGELIWEAQLMACKQVAEGVDSPSPRAIFVFFLYSAESDLYKKSNLAMRTRTDLETWRPFIFYVMREMRHVAGAPQTVYRGVPQPLTQAFFARHAPGAIIPYDGLTSTSVSLDVARSFLGSRPGVLYAIQIHTYEDIARFSEYPEEGELLLPPGSEFVVLKVVAPPTNLAVLELTRPLSHSECRALASVCVVMEQMKMPPLIPVPCTAQIVLDVQSPAPSFSREGILGAAMVPADSPAADSLIRK